MSLKAISGMRYTILLTAQYRSPDSHLYYTIVHNFCADIFRFNGICAVVTKNLYGLDIHLAALFGRNVEIDVA